MRGPAPKAEGATRHIHVVAALLIVGLAAGPAATHLYWMLGGTWGLNGSPSSTGIRVVAAVVVLLVVAALLVVLGRVGWWQQTLVPDRPHELRRGLGRDRERIVAVRPKRARDRTARARRGRLGRNLVALPPPAPDAPAA